MTTETRYKEITELVPSGGFYDASGYILPYRSGKTSLRLITESPNSNFGIYINEMFVGLVTTDVNGNAIFDIQLPLGDLILELRQEGTSLKIIAYITTKEYSVWHAAHATVMEGVDDYIEATLKAFRLDEAGATDIDLAHGIRLITPNEFDADLETYREILQSMRQAFRCYGGRLAGKYAVISAITQVNPLIFLRSVNAPRWILGINDLPNGDFQEAIRSLDGTDLATEINVIGDFVSLVDADSYVNTGNGILIYNRSLKRFTWTPPDYSFYFPVLSDPRYFDSPEINVDGEYTIKSGRSRAFFSSLYPPPAGDFLFGDILKRLYLNIDDRGEFAVDALSESNVLELAGAINSYMHSSNHYEVQRRVLNQPSVGLKGFIEIISVSDNTPLSVDPYIYDANGQLTATGGDTLSYQAPIDGASGPATIVTPGEVIRLFSDNSVEYVDVLVGHDLLPTVSDVFGIRKRYHSSTEVVSSKVNIISQNHFVGDGPSNIKILDGPYSGHRTAFGIDDKYANLQQSVVTGSQQVTVPAGTMENFSSVNNELGLPFDSIVGRGVTPDIIAISDIFDVVVNPVEPNLATITGIVTLQLKLGFTHIGFSSSGTILEQTQRGIHEIVSIDDGANTAIIRFGGQGVSTHAWETSPPSTFDSAFFLKVDPSVADYIVYQPQQARIDYVSATKLLKWKPPNGLVYGPAVDISVGGYFRLYSDAADNYKWLDVYVDPTNLAAELDHSDLRLDIKKEFYDFTGVSNATFWSMGERVIVTKVTPSGLDEIWDLKDPMINNYDISFGVYEVLPGNKIPPHKVSGEDDFGNLTIDTVISEAPTALIEPQATITAGEPKLPSGWVDRSAIPIEYVITPEAKYYKGALLIRNDANEVIFDRNVPYKQDQIGYLFNFKIWVRSLAPNSQPLLFKLGFDFGNGLIESSDISINEPNDTMQFPQMMEFSQVLPFDATKFKVSIKRVNSSPEFSIVEKAALFQIPFSSLFLGDGTIPRSGSRSSFGSLFYVWSSDELSTIEKSVLGVDAPSTTGLIREIHNTQEQIDAFDVTDVVTGDVVNVRGVIDEAEWVSAIISNLEVVSRFPTRFSYVKPISPTKVDAEEVFFTQSAPYIANILHFSDENQDESILYEDGVPLPNDQWVFNTQTEIEIISGFVPGISYTFDYSRLTRIETPPIDLETPPNNGNDTWFADYMVWNRHISSVAVVREKTSIFFNTAFSATLPRRSDASKFDSVLTEDSGTTQRIVPANTWSYTDFLTIKLDGDQYNPDAIYNLEYNQQLTDPIRATDIVAEIRSANTAYSLNSATYFPFDINSSVDGSKRFHQIRLTFTHITDVRDLRVHSAVIKGLNMTGVGSPPPGF